MYSASIYQYGINNSGITYTFNALSRDFSDYSLFWQQQTERIFNGLTITLFSEADNLLNSEEKNELYKFIFYTYAKNDDLNKCDIRIFNDYDDDSTDIYIEYHIDKTMDKMDLIKYISQLQYEYIKDASESIISKLYIMVKHNETM